MTLHIEQCLNAFKYKMSIFKQSQSFLIDTLSVDDVKKSNDSVSKPRLSRSGRT